MPLLIHTRLHPINRVCKTGREGLSIEIENGHAAHMDEETDPESPRTHVAAPPEDARPAQTARKCWLISWGKRVGVAVTSGLARFCRWVREDRFRTFVAGMLAVVVIAIAALIWGPQWLVPAEGTARGQLSAGQYAVAIASARQAILWAAGGAIAIFTLSETVRRGEHDREVHADTIERFQQQHDADSRTELRERFKTATEQLAHETGTVRMAGAHSLAGIADDWIRRNEHTEAAVAIKVLCSYLRAPRRDQVIAGVEVTPAQMEETSVRETIVQIIAEHLRPRDGQCPITDVPADAAPDPQWSNFMIDLSGMRIEHGRYDLRGIRITPSGALSLNDIVCEGTLLLDDLHVCVDARLEISGLHVRGGHVSCTRWRVGHTDVLRPESEVVFAGLRVLDVGCVEIGGLEVGDGGVVRMTGDRFLRNGRFHSSTDARGIGRAVSVRGQLSFLGCTVRGRLYCRFSVSDSGKLALTRVTAVGSGKVTISELDVSERGKLSVIQCGSRERGEFIVKRYDAHESALVAHVSGEGLMVNDEYTSGPRDAEGEMWPSSKPFRPSQSSLENPPQPK